MIWNNTHRNDDHPGTRASALALVFAIVMIGSTTVMMPKEFDAAVVEADNPLGEVVSNLNRQTSRFITVPSRF